MRVGIDRLGVYVLMLDGGGPEIALAPRPLLLEQNYPNPFGLSTTIAYTVPPSEWTGEAPIDVSLAIYNLLGQRVATLVAGPRVPGEHRSVWGGLDDGGRRVATGIYYYRLEVGGRSESRRLVYLK
ncbi:hypothetical protein AMJ82_04960 [candidate division TA06 bacterium SM23_40]|uniref:FlgD/Vpr Ig-like domain-containing protein n=1 Tax=candidate division TA06 bacterium SM23_40 TaxID=1703774 RepID=A0A0S8GB33_UNCT6|nr:MAG: hypothetical protein AMJ82_04960 [candidate division TA06 bacterium SM23_40]